MGMDPDEDPDGDEGRPEPICGFPFTCDVPCY